MCGKVMSTDPDVIIINMDEDAGISLVAREDKSKSRSQLGANSDSMPDTEAQLIVDAIATFQNNNRKRWDSRERLKPLKEAMIPGILMDRSFPQFYKIKVTEELDDAIRTGLYPATTTMVYRHTPSVPRGRTDGMKPLENREILMRYFEAFGRIVIEAQGYVFVVEVKKTSSESPIEPMGIEASKLA